MIRRRIALIGVALAMLLGSGLLAGCDNTFSSSSDAVSSEETAAADSSQQAPSKRPAPRTPQDGQSVASRVEDASTAARVKIALLNNSELGELTFNPSVHGERLTLKGDVTTRAQRKTAAEVAEDVEGVEVVRNRLLVAGKKVKAPQKEQPPEQIAEAKPPPEKSPSASTKKSRPASGGKSGSKPSPNTASASSSSNKNQKTEQQKQEKSSESSSSSAEYYTVKSGDSLWLIARKHDTSVSTLKQLNDLRSNSLHPGDKLRVR